MSAWQDPVETTYYACPCGGLLARRYNPVTQISAVAHFRPDWRVSVGWSVSQRVVRAQRRDGGLETTPAWAFRAACAGQITRAHAIDANPGTRGAGWTTDCPQCGGGIAWVYRRASDSIELRHAEAPLQRVPRDRIGNPFAVLEQHCQAVHAATRARVVEEEDMSAIVDLRGALVVVTGVAPGYTRETFEQALVQAGANPSDTVTYRTRYLIVGSRPGKVKVAAAASYGVPQLAAEQAVRWVQYRAREEGRPRAGAPAAARTAIVAPPLRPLPPARVVPLERLPDPPTPAPAASLLVPDRSLEELTLADLTPGDLRGRQVVYAGSYAGADNAYLRAQIVAAGATLLGQVVAGVGYLFAGDRNCPESALTRARVNGVLVVTRPLVERRWPEAWFSPERRDQFLADRARQAARERRLAPLRYERRPRDL